MAQNLEFRVIDVQHVDEDVSTEGVARLEQGNFARGE